MGQYYDQLQADLSRCEASAYDYDKYLDQFDEEEEGLGLDPEPIQQDLLKANEIITRISDLFVGDDLNEVEEHIADKLHEIKNDIMYILSNLDNM